MKRLILAVVLGLVVLSCFDLFLDPYHHETKVNFWVWAKRELTEIKEGEKE